MRPNAAEFHIPQAPEPGRRRGVSRTHLRGGGGYDELVILKDIWVVSFCEHHMLPFLGIAHVGYLPSDRVVGISKLARVVHGSARRLQIPEKRTAKIAGAIQEILAPRGWGW